MLEDFDKSVRMVPFSGKQVDWQVWSEQFLARARRKGYKDILKGKVKVMSDEEFGKVDMSTDEGKSAKKIRDLNDAAYETMLLLIDGRSQSGKVAFKIVSGCKTKELPDGDAALAWNRLSKKYESKRRHQDSC